MQANIIGGVDLDELTASYVATALWSTMDMSEPNGGRPLEDRFDPSDIVPETRERIEADCEDFARSHAVDLAIYFAELDFDASKAGHDFWLTRNGHGAGFWDRAYGHGAEAEAVCERLSEAARAYGEFDLYVTDSGEVA